MSAINSTSQTNPTQTLNQADFLKLLVTQMSSQDPLNPQTDTAFAAQLAQFSSLQATQTMTSGLQSIQATGLIGETVTLLPSNGASPVSGVVTSVQVFSGTPEVMVNGQAYNLNQILSVTATPTTAPPSNTSSTSTP